VIARVRSHIAGNAVAYLALFFALGGSSYAVVHSPDSRGVVHACYVPGTGAMRLVNGTHCRSSESALAWNRNGRAGVTGPQGLPGSPGNPGTPGGTGPTGGTGATGPSNGYFWWHGPSNIAQTCGFGGCNAEPTVGHLNVPAGDYLAYAKAEAFNDDTGFTSGGHCKLAIGVETDEQTLRLPKAEPFSGSEVTRSTEPVSLMVGGSFSSPGTITFTCGNNGYTHTTISDPKLTVIRVGSLSQPDS
jgi:hypothetical protein